jgi:hypothetical protein
MARIIEVTVAPAGSVPILKRGTVPSCYRVTGAGQRALAAVQGTQGEDPRRIRGRLRRRTRCASAVDRLSRPGPHWRGALTNPPASRIPIGKALPLTRFPVAAGTFPTRRSTFSRFGIRRAALCVFAPTAGTDPRPIGETSPNVARLRSDRSLLARGQLPFAAPRGTCEPSKLGRIGRMQRHECPCRYRTSRLHRRSGCAGRERLPRKDRANPGVRMARASRQ